MNQAQLLTVSLIAATCCFARPTLAQEDTIVFTDGTTQDKVTVTDFNLRDIKWRGRGGTGQRSSDQVASVDIRKVKDTYRRAYASARSPDGPGNFLQQADALVKKGDTFQAQFGFVEAARLFYDNGQVSEAFQCLEQLQAKCPDSGYVPALFQFKLDYYVGNGKGSDAASVADKYWTATQTQGYPKGFGIEAEYYQAVAKGLSGTLTGSALTNAMRQIQQKAAPYPNIADRARLQIANALRESGSAAEALREYEDLLDRDHSTDEIRAGSWLGIGHIKFKEGDPTNKQPYYDAMLAFLRVYVETPKGPPGIVAESLHMGSEAATKWGGQDYSRMSRRLKTLLAKQYPDNPWTNR